MILASIAEAATTPTPTSINNSGNRLGQVPHLRGWGTWLSTNLQVSAPVSCSPGPCSPSWPSSFTLKQRLLSLLMCQRKEPRLTFIDSIALHRYWVENVGEQSSAAEIILPNSWLRPITLSLYLTCCKEKRLAASYKVHCIFPHKHYQQSWDIGQSVATTNQFRENPPGHHNYTFFHTNHELEHWTPNIENIAPNHIHNTNQQYLYHLSTISAVSADKSLNTALSVLRLPWKKLTRLP